MILNEETGAAFKVASILDKFSCECLRYECSLIQLNRKTWSEKLANEKPDLLLVESAWHAGINLINLQKHKDNTLQSIVDWCKEHNVPTVFWNNEDPACFGRFIEAAKKFEYVFTTDADCIFRYKQVTGHDNIYLLLFAAQPGIHNPVGMGKEKAGRVAFAGTWYRSYPGMLKDLDMLFKAAVKHELHIYDRMYNYKISNYKYPHKYQPYIKGFLPYREMVSAYKKYDVFLNANISRDSPTTFSRRIYELLACGTNVISSYSPGLEYVLPDLVKLCKTEEDTEKWLEILLNDKNMRDRLSLLGQREVFNKHTYGHRMEMILEKTGFKYGRKDTPGVSIITCTNKPYYINNIFANYERQKYGEKELIIILNNNGMNLDEWREKAKQYENVKVFQLDEKTSLGHCLNYGIDRAGFEYAAKFDDDDYYGAEYIGDSLNAFIYTDAGVVGKFTFFCYFEESKTLTVRTINMENCYTQFIAGGTIMARKEVFNTVRFADVTVSEDTDFLAKCVRYGIKIYSASKFNYVYIRHGSTAENTWKVPDERYIRNFDIVARTDDYAAIASV